MSKISSSHKLLAFPISTLPPLKIVPAPVDRPWMSSTSIAFANRCLPLRIANESGWVILNDHEVEILWNGGKSLADLKVKPSNPAVSPSAMSHFGYGILTWRLPFIFRTPKGFDLRVRGPVNWYKDGIAPLEGIVEADWSVAGVSMNWKLTRPGTPIRFEAGDPICMLYPEQRGTLEHFEPELHDLMIDPELKVNFEAWSKSRFMFNKSLAESATDEKWQKHYFLGKHPSDDEVFPEHRVRVQLATFKDMALKNKSQDRLSSSQQTVRELCATPVELPETAAVHSDSSLKSAPFHIEDHFFERVTELRAQFERGVSHGGGAGAINPLSCAFVENAYQSITARVDSLFTQDLLLNLMERLRAWGRQKLAASHASTPRLWIYTNGCWRGLVRDEIRAKWHYMICLTRNQSRRAGKVRILADWRSGQTTRFGVRRVLSTTFRFNQLLVHETIRPYGIGDVTSFKAPLDGMVFLDGYFW